MWPIAATDHRRCPGDGGHSADMVQKASVSWLHEAAEHPGSAEHVEKGYVFAGS